MERVVREPGILRWRCVYGCVWLGRPTIHKLKTEYQWFKRISAGLTGFSGIKNAYRKCFFACGFGVWRAGMVRKMPWRVNFQLQRKSTSNIFLNIALACWLYTYMTNLPLCADSSKSVIECSGKCGNFARPFLYRAAGNYAPRPRHGDWKGQY